MHISYKARFVFGHSIPFVFLLMGVIIIGLTPRKATISLTDAIPLPSQTMPVVDVITNPPVIDTAPVVAVAPTEVPAAAAPKKTTKKSSSQSSGTSTSSSDSPSTDSGSDSSGSSGDTGGSTTTSPPPSTPPPTSSGPVLGGCQIFPANNPWNTDISNYPVDTAANVYMNIGGHLQADFGSDPTYGIPITIVSAGQATVPITFTAYGDQSDPGPYPVPFTASVEGGTASTGDRHVIVLQQGNCKLYEMFRAFQVGSGWNADSGAVFNLSSNALRPDFWTSADAAGLPILPGLARYDELASGQLTHALRFTYANTRKGFIHPATHYASDSVSTARPPMGARIRLKASFDTSSYTGMTKVILEGLKKYGMILSDNGANWYVSGATDSRWNDDDLQQLRSVQMGNFEAVATGPIIN